MTAALRPFHYAFLVADLDATRRFYGEVLGCREGRSSETWVDFDFFGSQISCHISAAVPQPESTGRVEDKLVPMPHFGAVLAWDEFGRLAERIRGAGYRFVLEPFIRYQGQPGEQQTMFLLDPSGNALEFKAFRREEEMV
jgi:uncharacterized protein